MMDTTKHRLTRRALISGGAAFSVLGFPVPFARFLPAGMQPVALAQENILPGKSGLSVLSDRPIAAETPPHLLDENVTSGEHMFVRNNGLTPAVTAEDVADWRLVIDGEVETTLDLSIDDLKNDFEEVKLQLQIECGGNGRKFMTPAARGNQWTFGAVSCANWTGVRLRDVLDRAGVKSTAVYTGHYGADIHLSGDPEKSPLSRGIPIEKAIEPHTIIAYAMNGGDIPLLNGYPLRLAAPGWPGSCSQKWLTRIEVRDREHDGAKMTGQSYRVPRYPVAPGTEVPDEDMEIIQSMPVKSLITAPQTGARVSAGDVFEVRGHAWAGDNEVAAMDVSIDFGATWTRAELSAPVNRYAWQHWRVELTLPEAGYYEVWARATDDAGRMQPATQPGWNPRGYLNNLQHRIAIFAL
ncbi:sulfite oxidase [Hyphococcus flavus]|uniref:Sulfite oxidase n=1 Tax=Hyphococcus flavus TaxID=1866326 RepID=A0AAE9ZG48_9PROT|nr:sulfite oxidase [Hyphococcus flavus]WDI30231.1 sulfite oxidase [Hyphococcus flavus]